METLRTLSFYFTRPVYSRRSPTNQSKQNLISLFLAAHSCLLWICKTMACVLFEFFQENHLTRTKALQLFQRFQTIAGPNKRCITPKKEWQTPSPTTKKKIWKFSGSEGEKLVQSADQLSFVFPQFFCFSLSCPVSSRWKQKTRQSFPIFVPLWPERWAEWESGGATD